MCIRDRIVNDALILIRRLAMYASWWETGFLNIPPAQKWPQEPSKDAALPPSKMNVLGNQKKILCSGFRIGSDGGWRSELKFSYIFLSLWKKFCKCSNSCENNRSSFAPLISSSLKSRGFRKCPRKKQDQTLSLCTIWKFNVIEPD